MRLFVNQLTNLDFSYLDQERGLVGETWVANIELEGTLDEQGMVCDFGTVKKTIREWLDENIDHKLLIPTKAPNLVHCPEEKADSIVWETDVGLIKTQAPSCAHTHIPAENICMANVAEWCVKQLRILFPDSVDKLRLTFTTETILGPYYHYSHGLKKHQGNCQRIAHGHRSKIEIWQDEELSTSLMQNISESWADIYIGTVEDCEQDPDCENNYLFQYNAMQGEFALSLPKTCCYLLDTESTVELIAEHLSSKLKRSLPSSSLKVQAYEGLAKGAIAEK